MNQSSMAKRASRVPSRNDWAETKKGQQACQMSGKTPAGDSNVFGTAVDGPARLPEGGTNVLTQWLAPLPLAGETTRRCGKPIPQGRQPISASDFDSVVIILATIDELLPPVCVHLTSATLP